MFDRVFPDLWSPKGLTPSQIEVLVASPAVADYFEDAVDGGDRMQGRVAGRDGVHPWWCRCGGPRGTEGA